MNPQTTLFHFDSHTIDLDSHRAVFRYRVEFADRDPITFTETLVLPRTPGDIHSGLMQRMLESLHLILGISYYKLYCPSEISMSFHLSQEQADFWNTVYRKGLGEFLYRNKLSPNRLAKFPYADIEVSPYRAHTEDRSLLGIGGGKDSIVAATLLRDFDVTSFLVETERADGISERVMEEIGRPSLVIRRMLDPQIFEAHEGSYNGHIPISAIFGFVGLFTAALYGYKYVIVANEQSSNFGNIEYEGEMINHQWSKSMEFEMLLQEYTRKYITPDITYFSLLRQFYEIRVAQMFASEKKFFPFFSSCNRSFRVSIERPEHLWCGECPKCVFVFLMLSPFLREEELLGIFRKNLFEDTALIPLFRDVLGLGDMKPFDCVGTFEESQAALFLASERFADTAVVRELLPSIQNPSDLVQKVFRTASAPTLPTPFRFLGVKKVGILGYGREGHVTEAYIRKTYPHLEIGILDKNDDDQYLERQNEFDLVVKTPGISKTKVNVPYVTATNVFFSQNKNFTIGVTGSKGKSTTASLIFEMLKAGGKKVRLIGNIGSPMLGVFSEAIDPEEIFVVELSSYMLDDIEYSPNIAVLLNLFPEHMDYHGGVENYYAAKENIFRFQKAGDTALRFPFSEEIPLSEEEIPLLGKHNQENIRAALAVARLLDISDEAIKEAIMNFKPLPHRLECAGTFEGITFYDDAISTTPESTMMALEALPDVDTIFLGGADRGYDFMELEKSLRAHHVRNIVLFPKTGERMLTSRDGFTIFETESMEEAVAFAFQHTASGKVCLLSTASPSYSLWKDFEEKGVLFKRAVRSHAREGKDI